MQLRAGGSLLFARIEIPCAVHGDEMHVRVIHPEALDGECDAPGPEGVLDVMLQRPRALEERDVLRRWKVEDRGRVCPRHEQRVARGDGQEVEKRDEVVIRPDDFTRGAAGDDLAEDAGHKRGGEGRVLPGPWRSSCT